jgi:hypothetical protein
MNFKIIYILSLLFLFTSCYASGKLGVIQKINDADMIIESIGKVIENTNKAD